MSRTRRRKRDGTKREDRDGTLDIYGSMPSNDFTIEVQRRDRRARDAEADRIARGEVNPDDTPAKPVRRRLWQFWRRW